VKGRGEGRGGGKGNRKGMGGARRRKGVWEGKKEMQGGVKRGVGSGLGVSNRRAEGKGVRVVVCGGGRGGVE